MQRSVDVDKREITEIKSMKRPDATGRNTTQRSAEVQEREIRKIKSMKRPSATQRGSVRKRNQRKNVDEEG